jgi:hypothetical protein
MSPGAAEHRVLVYANILPGKEAKPAPLNDLELIFVPPDFAGLRHPRLIDVKHSYLSALISVLGKRVNTSWTVVTLSDQN